MLLRVIDERRRPCFHCFVLNPLSISNSTWICPSLTGTIACWLNITTSGFVWPCSEYDHTVPDIPSACCLSCTVHTLQLVIKDALQQVSNGEKIIKEWSSVVGFFHRSLHWGCELKKSTGGLKLMAAVPTRWNSALLMMRRLVEENVCRAASLILVKARNAGSGSVPRLSATRPGVTAWNVWKATNSLQADIVTSSMVILAKIFGVDGMLTPVTSSMTLSGCRLRRARLSTKTVEALLFKMEKND